MKIKIKVPLTKIMIKYNMKHSIFIGMLLLIGVAYLFSMCSNRGYNYTISHYTDTINGHVILTTVCDNDYSQSVSTLELNNN